MAIKQWSFPLALLIHTFFSASIVSMSCSDRLTNQRVLITGAGRGIGRAIALVFQQEGARVAIVARTQSKLEETALLATSGSNESGSSMTSVHVADVTNESQVEDTVDSIVREWGSIDILVNNTGGLQTRKAQLWDLSLDDLQGILDLNVVGVHVVSLVVLRKHMLPAGNGRIVNISSRVGKVGLQN